MLKNIYVDMDGVLCNFDKRYFELFNEPSSVSREKKEFSKNWTDFVMGKNFQTLEVFPGAYDLLNFLNSLKNVKLEILSSSGGEKYHDEVEKQKRIWLINHGVTYKPNIVSSRKLKSEFANPDSLLIDDTRDVVKSFIDASGKAILHTDALMTIGIIKQIMLYDV
jgi:hypothetical protein